MACKIFDKDNNAFTILLTPTQIQTITKSPSFGLLSVQNSDKMPKECSSNARHQSIKLSTDALVL